MESLRSAIYVMMVRPATAVFISLMGLVYCIIEGINPLSKLAMKFISSGKGDITSSIIATVQFVMDFNQLLPNALIVLAIAFFGGLICAFVLSGYFYVLTNIVERRPKVRGEFFTGVGRYYGKLFKASFLTILSGILLFVFLLIISVPAIITTKSLLAGKGFILPVALLVDVVTAAVLFLSLLFFRIYFFFWYPAIFYTGDNALKNAKLVMDNCFWDPVGRLIGFDIVFILFQVGYAFAFEMTGNGNLVLFGVNWVFKTLFFVAAVTYIFRSFRFYLEQYGQAIGKRRGKPNAAPRQPQNQEEEELFEPHATDEEHMPRVQNRRRQSFQEDAVHTMEYMEQDKKQRVYGQPVNLNKDYRDVHMDSMERSMPKSPMHRENTPGYSADANAYYKNQREDIRQRGPVKDGYFEQETIENYDGDDEVQQRVERKYDPEPMERMQKKIPPQERPDPRYMPPPRKIDYSLDDE